MTGAKGMVQGSSGTGWMVATLLKLRTWIGKIMSLDFNVSASHHNEDTQFRAGVPNPQATDRYQSPAC